MIKFYCILTVCQNNSNIYNLLVCCVLHCYYNLQGYSCNVKEVGIQLIVHRLIRHTGICYW